MSDFWDENADAENFCQYVLNNVDSYKLFPNEKFENFNSGILATTGVDRQGEAFNLKSLEKFARDINSKPFWMGAFHDPLIQPIGRIIAGKVFFAPKSKIHFLAAVTGYYDISSYPKFKDLGIDPHEFEIEDHKLPKFYLNKARIKFALNEHEVDINDFKNIIKNAPNYIDKSIELRFRKGAELDTIISILIPLWLAAFNPFSKKFLERYGEAAANVTINIFKWLTKKVFNKISQIKNKRVLVEYVSYQDGCNIQFVINSRDPQILVESLNSLNIAAQSSMTLIEKLKSLGIQKLIYEYNLETKKWLPLHAVTIKAGVISERPFLIALDQLPSLSIGGIIDKNKSVN